LSALLILLLLREERKAGGGKDGWMGDRVGIENVGEWKRGEGLCTSKIHFKNPGPVGPSLTLTLIDALGESN